MKKLKWIFCTILALSCIMVSSVNFANSVFCEKEICTIDKGPAHTHKVGDVLTGEQIMNDTCHVFLPVGNAWIHHELPILEEMKALKFEVAKNNEKGLYVKPISEEFGTVLENYKTTIENSDIYKRITSKSHEPVIFNKLISGLFLERLLQLNPNISFEFDGHRVKNFQQIRDILKLNAVEGKSKLFPGLLKMYEIDGSFIVSKKDDGTDNKGIKAAVIKYEPKKAPVAGLEHGIDYRAAIK